MYGGIERVSAHNKTVVNGKKDLQKVYQVSRMGSSKAQNIHSINLDNDIVNLLLLLTLFLCVWVKNKNKRN
jgi:hypothetical protein